MLVVFGDAIAPEINARVRAFDAALQRAAIPGVVESVPAYCSVAVHYRPEVLSAAALAEALRALTEAAAAAPDAPRAVIRIPVLYGGEFGPDLAFVAKHAGMSEAGVIKLHTEPEYLIHMMGFMPGFPYLGGLRPEIAAPRLPTPRVKIPAGSVGIAGSQTGAYPVDSPGGWRLIGRTPIRLYDPAREKPILLDAGQYVKFVSIDRGEFLRIGERVAAGEYEGF